MERQRETLGSRLGFILLSAGCAIGLGNVWRFPFITGKYGGAAFVLVYLVFLALFGLPIMVMEFAIGRAARRNIAGALRALEPAGTRWHLYGPVAIADVLRAGGTRGWRAVGTVLGTRPVLVVARPVYRWIARHRDRMPGGTPACAIPAAERTHPPT